MEKITVLPHEYFSFCRGETSLRLESNPRSEEKRCFVLCANNMLNNGVALDF